MCRPLLVLSLTATLLVVPVVCSQNQPSSPQSPVVNETVFQTPAGKVKVYLPSDMAAGDTISGTVVAEPAAAKDPQQQKKNSDELNGYVVQLDRNRARVTDKQLHWKIPAAIAAGVIPLLLKDAKGKSLAQSSIQIATTPAVFPAFTIPNAAQVGRPIQIHGPFDGDSANTIVAINGSSAPVLVESPRQVVVQNPQSSPGATTVVISENGAATSGAFRNLRIDLTAPKTSLMRGEKTELTVAVQGLAGLTEPVPVRLRNLSPEVVELSGGNNQTIPVGPGTAPTQTFTRTLTGVSAGQFNIVADLVVPATTASGATPSTTPPSPPPPPPPPSLPTSTGGPTTSNPAPTTATGMPAPSPSPIKSTGAPPNIPAEAGTVPAMPVATPSPKENPCCKKIRDKNEAEFGRRLLWRQGNNDLEILGPFLFIRVNGVEAKWKFDRNLEEVFCYLDKYEIDSEVRQALEDLKTNGKNLSDEDRKAMAAMSKLLDEDVFDCHTAEPTLRAFLGV
jgi:hypothetical protein